MRQQLNILKKLRVNFFMGYEEIPLNFHAIGVTIISKFGETRAAKSYVGVPQIFFLSYEC